MADGKIYITITDEPLTRSKGGQGGGKDDDEFTPDDEIKYPRLNQYNYNSLFSDFAKHQFFNFVESQAKQFISYSINNIGNFTGSYQTQRQIQETLTIGGMILNVGMSAVAGAKVAGLPGAIIGAGISTASQFINLGYRDHTMAVQTKQQNREIAMMRKISGLDGLTNGSRWGQ